VRVNLGILTFGATKIAARALSPDRDVPSAQQAAKPWDILPGPAYLSGARGTRLRRSPGQSRARRGRRLLPGPAQCAKNASGRRARPRLKGSNGEDVVGEKTPPTVLITGAAQRIGRALAGDFAARGWRVAIHCLASQRQARDLAQDLGRRTAVAVLSADLADAGEVARLIPECSRQLGPPTCLINNAAMFAPDAVGALNSGLWDTQLAVNLKAPVFLAEAFAKHLPPDVEGNVINIIDQGVLKPTPQFFSYTVSKAALWATTRTLAQALAPSIRVNAIGPGPVLKSAHQTEAQFQAEYEATLLRRSTHPEEIAAAIRFILEAPTLTGQMLTLDGGQHLAWQTPDVTFGSS
jgi:NAD(P)-dependent dehydrogenase (short-subunit alcohol dehydrogenase family)